MAIFNLLKVLKYVNWVHFRHWQLSSRRNLISGWHLSKTNGFDLTLMRAEKTEKQTSPHTEAHRMKK